MLGRLVVSGLGRNVWLVFIASWFRRNVWLVFIATMLLHQLFIDVRMVFRLRFASDRWHNFLVLAFVDFDYWWQTRSYSLLCFYNSGHFLDFSFWRSLALR
jgi:hypothetical protein